MAAHTIDSDFRAQEEICHCLHLSLSIFHKVMELDAVSLVFLILSSKLAFSLFSFTLIKRLFNSSLLSAIKLITSAYLRLLIFLLAIFLPACNSSNLAFPMMWSAYKLNKLGDNKLLVILLFQFWMKKLFHISF